MRHAARYQGVGPDACLWRPRPSRSPGGRMTRGVLTLAAAIAVTVWPGRAAAQAADTLTVREAVAVALEANPMLRAARLRAAAAAERVPQAGALPDPVLELGVANRMVNDFGSAMEPMTMNEVRVTQMIPWPGVRGFARERAAHLADAERLEAADAEAMLAARVSMTYYELAYMDRALNIMESTRQLLREFVDVTGTMYQVGTGLQQDVLQAQVGVARMTEDITVMAQRRTAMAARLNALLGRPATDRVGALALPAPETLPPDVDSLMQLAAARRPALRAAQAREAAAAAGYRAARRELYPDFMVSAGYGQRPEFPDMATVMVGLRLPLWAGSRQLPMRREMAAMHAMSAAEALDLRNETYASLVEWRSEAVRSSNLARLYATAVVPQARASVAAALAAYRVGRVDYMTLVDNQMTVNRYEIEAVRLQSEYHRAVAEIEALIGGMPGGTQ